MPVFEFECKECQQHFEDLVFGNKLEGVLCPTCGSDRVRKKMSTFVSKIGGDGASLSLGSSPAAACSTGGT
jgi:putative FmdB family regulatory protein